MLESLCRVERRRETPSTSFTFMYNVLNVLIHSVTGLKLSNKFLLACLSSVHKLIKLVRLSSSFTIGEGKFPPPWM